MGSVFGGGGGGVDTSGLEEATREATQLQRDMYEQGREDLQPWYQMGTGAVSKLSDLLGISGGSVKSRDDIYNELLPQYTTQETTTSNGGVPNMYVDQQGNVRVFDELTKHQQNALDQRGSFGGSFGSNERTVWSPYSTSETTENINYDALNAAVAAQMELQGETPEGFGSLLQKFDNDTFEKDAGYQFRQDEAKKALERSMAAQGITLGGAGFGDINPSAYRAMEEMNQGIASQEYNNAYNRYTQDQLNTFNMLMGASGQGSGVAGQQVAAGQAYGQNVGNLQTGLASAQLNADLANQASSGGMFDSLLGVGGLGLQAYTTFSDRTLKTNITEAGTENGHKLYEFNYIGDDTRYKGVMAQDLLSYIPEAVHEVDGKLAVDYSMLGLDMEVV